MKRLFPPPAALIVLGSPVHAADSISFVVGGHRIHIEASRHCNSASCLSVSIPGVYERRGRDRYDNDRDATALAQPPSPPPSPQRKHPPFPRRATRRHQASARRRRRFSPPLQRCSRSSPRFNRRRGFCRRKLGSG
jgi:hypothetical protein